MEKIEVLLKKDLASNFDTRKMLNRSSLAIDQSIIDNLENGLFTCEAIDTLAGKFPIFKYRTCITIHGSWPEISRTRIGGYKNVHQNLNGSVEVYYSAIDVEKIHKVAQTLRAVGSNFHYQESSTERGFYWMLPITNREELLQAQTKMQPIAEKLTALKLYGYVSLYTAKDFFRQFLVLAVIPLALPENLVSHLESELTGFNSDEISTKVNEYKEAQRQKEAQRKAENEQYAKEQKEKAQKIIERANELRPTISHLIECNDINAGTLVKIFYEQSSDKIRFVYYRKTGAGAFGRVKWSKAFSDTFISDFDALKWQEQKQKMQSEFNLKEFRIALANGRKINRAA